MRRRNESNFGQQRTRQQGISTVGNTLVFGQQDTFQQHQDQATFFQNTVIEEEPTFDGGYYE